MAENVEVLRLRLSPCLMPLHAWTPAAHAAAAHTQQQVNCCSYERLLPLLVRRLRGLQLQQNSCSSSSSVLTATRTQMKASAFIKTWMSLSSSTSSTKSSSSISDSSTISCNISSNTCNEERISTASQMSDSRLRRQLPLRLPTQLMLLQKQLHR
ncbi:hypothetical protein Emag_000195 [Eimeria magna]